MGDHRGSAFGWLGAALCLALLVGATLSTIRQSNDIANQATMGMPIPGGPVAADVPEPLPPDPPAEATATCRRQPASIGDVDGDGTTDTVAHYYVDDRPDLTFVTAVCLATGRYVEGHDLGHESFHVWDLDADGHAEILAGGTSASDGVMTVYRLEGNRIAPVTLGGVPLEVRWGVLRFDDKDQQVAASTTWGCQDLAGDTRREVVQLDADFENRTQRTVAYDISGRSAKQVYDRAAPLPAEATLETWRPELGDCWV